MTPRGRSIDPSPPRHTDPHCVSPPLSAPRPARAGAAFSLPEYIHAARSGLMKTGWRVKEIDEADGPAFLRPRAWDAVRAQDKKSPGTLH